MRRIDSVSRAEMLETYADLYEVFDDNPYIRKELDKVYDQLNGLQSVEPERKWIPCSERLPEEIGFYLVKVCAEYRPVRIYAFYPLDMDKERKYWINDSDSHSHVFNHFVEAWMPLPSPYKKDGGE